MWTIKCTLLEEQDYVVNFKVNDIIKPYKEEEWARIVDQVFTWDLLKCKFTGETVTHSKRKRQTNLEIKEQHATFADLDERINTPQNLKLIEQYNIINCELNILFRENINGVIIRNEARLFEEGDKYFLNLEKHNYNKTIMKIIYNNVKF